MRIVFLGTPDFAVATLAALLDNNFNVVAVITAPDKPAGRGKKLKASAVKQFAVANNLPVLQPTNLKNKEFQQTLANLQADIQIVVAFRMLPEAVFNMPRLGTFNLHASLLPQYRGAAPINWAIINGEAKTGVTTFFLKKKIDTGDLLFQEEVTIEVDDTAGTLHDKLMNIGAALVVKTMNAIIADDYQAIPQQEPSVIRAAPKIYKQDCVIDWVQDVTIVYNFIRGLSPYPAARTTIGNKIIKIFEAQIQAFDKETDAPEAASILSDGSTFLKIACNNGFIVPNELQLEGRKRMKLDDFLRGYGNFVVAAINS